MHRVELQNNEFLRQFETIINEVALLRNKWLGIMKGLDAKQWQMGHIVRLRTAGMEDIRIE